VHSLLRKSTVQWSPLTLNRWTHKANCVPYHSPWTLFKSCFFFDECGFSPMQLLFLQIKGKHLKDLMQGTYSVHLFWKYARGLPALPTAQQGCPCTEHSVSCEWRKTTKMLSTALYCFSYESPFTQVTVQTKFYLKSFLLFKYFWVSLRRDMHDNTMGIVSL